MGQGDPDAEKDRAADDRPEDFVAESVHVALHQSHDWRIGDRSIAGCARAHALFARASPAIRSVYNSRIGRRPTLCDRDDPESKSTVSQISREEHLCAKAYLE